ncbi:MAG: ATP-binding protein [Acidobacteria bacterium]|nr:ATP-binding protein [Acidobacteriota bacterium]
MTMMTPHVGLERRVLDALEQAPARVVCVVGGCGTGRSTLLHAVADRLGRDTCQFIDVERAASTPERFLRAVMQASPFLSPTTPHPPTSARDAFDRLLRFFATVSNDRPRTFLLDEVLASRTFESFPGLRHAQRELLAALVASPHRFVLTSRFVRRTQHLLRDVASRIELITLPALSADEVTAMLPPGPERDDERLSLGQTVQALTDGRATYVHALVTAASRMGTRSGDPISALTALLTRDGDLAAWCAQRYEWRLQQARGYGALKAILEILADAEPLNLTEIAQQMQRTPGSTKDYLSWLEDVDLVVSHQKRYRFADPLLRLWVRLYCRPEPPSVDVVAREVHAFAATRLPGASQATSLRATGDRRAVGIIEID